MKTILDSMQMLRAADGVDAGGGGSTSPGPAPSLPSSGSPDAGSPPSTSTSSSSSSSSPSPSTPATAPTGGLKDASPEPTDMFANIGNTDDLDALISPEILAPQAPATSSPAQAAPPPVVQPAGPTPQPAAQAAQPAEPAPVQPAQPSPQATEPQGPVDIVAELEKNRDALLLGLADEQFTLSDEDKAAFGEDPNNVLPHIAAKVYYMGVVNTAKQMKSILNNLPQMFDRYMQTREGNSKAEDAFFKMWPKLDRAKPEVKDMVMKTAVAYRSANPKLTAEGLHKIVGQVVSAHFGLPIEAVVASAPPAQKQNVQVTPVPTGFTPAAVASPGVMPNGHMPPAENLWDGLGLNFDG